MAEDALKIRRLASGDLAGLSAAFSGPAWGKTASIYERYLDEQARGRRVALLAFVGGALAGYVTLNLYPTYPPLKEANLPEVQDLCVLASFRRRGVASRLLDEAERLAAESASAVAIAVGLYADYGPAMRLYVRRGYIPDGRGVTYGDRPLAPGASTVLDDDLLLRLIKPLP
jgi:GNAT superfamily N-acetyltransferase